MHLDQNTKLYKIGWANNGTGWAIVYSLTEPEELPSFVCTDLEKEYLDNNFKEDSKKAFMSQLFRVSTVARKTFLGYEDIR